MERYSSYKDNGEKWLGEIPGHWEFKKVKHLYTMQTGFTPNTKVPEFYSDSNDNVWVNISDMKTKNISDSESHISNLYIKQFKPSIVPKGSLLYSFKLSVGEVAFANTDLYTNEAIVSFLPSKNIDLRFLYYSAPLCIIKNANENIYGAKILNQHLIKNALIVFPPLPEQRAIVEYLDKVTSDIDRAITQSQRMIDLLNERKQIIIQHAVTKGLNPNAKLKQSGVEWIGEVPEEWKVRKLRYLCKIKTGDKDTIMRVEDGEYPFFVRSPKIERINSYTFDTEAILMAGDGAGAGRIFHYYKGKFGCHQRVYCLHNFSLDVYPQFLYYQLSHFFKEVFLGVSAKSTVDSVRLPMLKDFQIVFPSVSEQQLIVDHIEKTFEPISQAIASTERKIALLRERKQIIINEVVTGKVKVS